MSDRTKLVIGAATIALAGAWLSPARAHAHFTLLKPDSWLVEDALGGPQKGGPCGPGGYDDVEPVPYSSAVTTFHAGDTVSVQWQEEIYHPGYFRIALAPVAAKDATSTDFPDPPLTDAVACNYDKAAVPTGAHDNVLADGLFMTDTQLANNRSLMQDVTLPNQPCDHCTLQVVQVMEGHGPPNCFYFHCADITILPADGSAGAGGSTGAADGGVVDAGVMGTGGMAGSTTPPGTGATGGSGTPPPGAGGSGGGAAGMGGGTVGTSPPSGTGTGAASGAATGGSAASTDSSMGAAGAGSGHSGGCSVDAHGSPHSAFAFLALVLAGLWQRRRD